MTTKPTHAYAVGKGGLLMQGATDLLLATSAHAPRRRQISPIVARGVTEPREAASTKAVTTARRGARPVGIDNSDAQLRSARCFQREFGLEFSLWHGNAETVPATDGSFDLAISEYGASIWCDPYRWIPEAARLLRPGGQLIFLVNGVIAVLTFPDDPDAPAGDRLLRPYFGMHRLEWSGEEGVNFYLPHGEMIALLRRCGFVLEELLEVRPPDGSVTSFPLVTLEWAQQWPCEEIWKATKQA